MVRIILRARKAWFRVNLILPTLTFGPSSILKTRMTALLEAMRSKVKVGKINFPGNHAFSDRKLIRAMRPHRPYSIPLYFWYIPVLTKTYDRQKLSEDLEVGVRGLYRDNGYFKVSVGEPVLENIDTA